MHSNFSQRVIWGAAIAECNPVENASSKALKYMQTIRFPMQNILRSSRASLSLLQVTGLRVVCEWLAACGQAGYSEWDLPQNKVRNASSIAYTLVQACGDSQTDAADTGIPFFLTRVSWWEDFFSAPCFLFEKRRKNNILRESGIGPLSLQAVCNNQLLGVYI